MATYETSDESVVVVIGSGAGGGTLANELCQKGVNVVLLEAGKRQSTATYVNDEWAPYYDKAEDKLGVTRTHDIAGLPGNNNFKVFYNGAKKLGYRNVHTGRMAINSKPRKGRLVCMQIGFCFQGCKSGAKWSTLYADIPEAEATGRLDLRPESFVTRIEHDGAGKVSGVVYFDKDGKEQRQKARAVCVACNSIETARLLLNSQSSQHPNGLANSSGQVGRSY